MLPENITVDINKDEGTEVQTIVFSACKSNTDEDLSNRLSGTHVIQLSEEGRQNLAGIREAIFGGTTGKLMSDIVSLVEQHNKNINRLTGAGEERMQTTANNILTGTSFTGETFVITKAVLISHKDEDTIIVWKQDGTIDIAGYGSGYRCLADEAFDGVVRTQDLRGVTYINRAGQIVELQRIDGTTYIKKITKYVKDRVTSQYDRPRNKARIQGFGQNVAPFIDAGFGVNRVINKDDFDPTTLQTHHINGRESDDRPENLVTLPYFVHYKLHKRSINRDTELLYDEEAYIGRCLVQVTKERRDELLLNLNEFETFCEGLGIVFKYRSKLYKARHVMVTAFDTSNDNKLEIVYEDGFAQEILRLQYLYYLGKRRLKTIVEIEQEEQDLLVTQ